MNHKTQIAISNLLTVPSMNASRSDNAKAWFKDDKDLVDLAACFTASANGWDDNEGTLGIVPLAHHFGQDAGRKGIEKALKAAEDYRKAELAYWDTSDHTFKAKVHGQEVIWTSADCARYLHKVWGDGTIDYKLPAKGMPKVETLADIEKGDALVFQSKCFRRLRAFFPHGDIMRHKLGLPCIEVLDARVFYYEGDFSQRQRACAIDCIRENEFKGKHSRSTTMVEKLISCKHHIFDACSIQQDARRAFGDGTGQKLWAACECGSRLHDRDIIVEIASKDEASAIISAWDKEKLRKLSVEGTPEEILSYVLDPGKAPRKVRMSNADLEALAVQHPNPVVRATARAVLVNDKSLVGVFTDPLLKESLNSGIKAHIEEVMLDNERDFDEWIESVTGPLSKQA
jgi:hypothetical protein